LTPATVTRNLVLHEKPWRLPMSTKTNLTLSLDSDLLRDAKVLAARRGTSVSRLMADQLEDLVRRDREYERARQRALARLERGFDLGWTPPTSRDELHER
jgi:hypothetical protein